MPPPDREEAKIRALEARIATLEQLLDVYERSVLDQSEKLVAETTLLECQGEATLDGILSVSRDGTTLFANRRLSELWGVQHPEQGANSEASLRQMADQTVEPERLLAMTRELEDEGEAEAELVLRDGRSFYCYTAPIRSADGALFGRVWYFRDISESKKVEQLKNEFISTVSHELRTPLTSIRGSLGLMEGGVIDGIPEQALGLIEVAHNSCKRLERIINDILDIEKIEAGRIDFELKPVPLAPLIESSIDSNRSYGDQFGVTFEFDDCAPGARVIGDEDRLIQVMTNLLSNAAKYSPPNGVVRISLSRLGTELNVAVRDEGKGIPHQLRDRIFERFARSEDDTGHVPSSGLGLNIARAIVERLGGRMSFESTPGEGATFFFLLPELKSG